MPDSLRLTTVLAATPEQVYRAWLSSSEHSAFTGSRSEVEARVGGAHTAWDGYIVGRVLELETDRRIVMAWRTTEFPPGAPDSRVDILLMPEMGGTRVTLVHTGIPSGDGVKYDEGWKENYFEPMAGYFRANAKAPRRRTSKAARKPAPKSPKRKAAPHKR
ncbi:MAG: SRPBCC domain-containing protein [Anaerolineales bacterium]